MGKQQSYGYFCSLFCLRLIEPKTPVARYLTVGFIDCICTVWAKSSDHVDLFSSTEVNGATINMETLHCECVPQRSLQLAKSGPASLSAKLGTSVFFRHEFISWLLKSSWEFGGEIRGFLKSECWRCPEDFFLTEVWVALHCN